VRLIDLRLGEGRIAAEGHLLALRLLPVDLEQQQILPTVGTVDVAGAQLDLSAAKITSVS